MKHTEPWIAGGFGLYVHWPFCQSKCPYCDFNSHVAGQQDSRIWEELFLSELDRLAETTAGRPLDSIFFGGGTPSLMEPKLVEAVITRTRKHWRLGNSVEITLEANPGSVDMARFRDFAAAGVSRVSMGFQSLRDQDLRRLGRLHSVADARKAFDIARACFDRVSFDLIYARQDQTAADWRAELTEALTMAVDHLSLYQLTIEEGTAFHDRHRRGGLHGLPDEDRAADLYELTQEICGAAGMPSYEVSNHARPGAECRHNLIYWRMGDYMGIGPGAHGRLTTSGQRFATVAERDPAAWMARVHATGSGDVQRDPLSPADQAEELAIMSMRLTEGMDIARYESLMGRPLPETRVSDLEAQGLVARRAGRLVALPAGRLVLNAIIRSITQP